MASGAAKRSGQLVFFCQGPLVDCWRLGTGSLCREANSDPPRRRRWPPATRRAGVALGIPDLEFFEAKSGRVTRLRAGETPALDVHSLCGRPVGTELWALELILDESEDDMWMFRREPAIRRAPATKLDFGRSDRTGDSAASFPYQTRRSKVTGRAATPRSTRPFRQRMAALATARRRPSARCNNVSDGDLTLQTREGCPKTEMNALSERDVTIGLARKVQNPGLGELTFVSVR